MRFILNRVGQPMTSNDETVVYSAILRPHRSAGARATRIVIGIVAVIWLIPSIVFAVVGAWPVLPFAGVELLALYALLRLNQRAADTMEAINLSRSALTVHRVDHWGKRSSVSFPPNWLQVNVDPLGPVDNRLELRSHGRSVIIASFLMPQERVELARALRRELARLAHAPQPA
jgi:uncharacterized membrane protein